MTRHPCGRCDNCAAETTPCLAYDGRIHAPDDPWLIEQLCEDDSPTALFFHVDKFTVVYDIDQIDMVVKALRVHEEDCLMQDSPLSAAFIDGIIAGLRGFPRG